jgi:hypothetical protein
MLLADPRRADLAPDPPHRIIDVWHPSPPLQDAIVFDLVLPPSGA